MRKYVIAFSLILAILSTNCSKGKDTGLSFTTYEHYFVNNTFPVDSIGNFLMIQDTASFNRVFGAAANMGKNTWIAPSDFNEKSVISVIKDFGNNLFELKIKKVSRTNAILRVDYEYNLKEQNLSYTMTGNSIVMANIQSCNLIEFYENGRLVKQVSIPNKNK